MKGALLSIVLGGCGRLGFETTAIVGSDAATDAAACQAVTGGLLGHWSMDAADVSGTMVLDRSGNDRHGMLIGTPRPVVGPGRIGEGLDYAATGVGYVDLPALPVDSTGGASNSVAMWFFQPNPDVDEVLVYLPATANPSPPRYDLWLTTDGSGVPSLCINSGASECWGISDAGLIGRWVHVVAVFANGDTTGGTLFVDGEPVLMECQFGSCDQSRVAQGPFTIGGSDTTYSWHGQIDDVRFYDRGLSATEAATLVDCAP